MRIYISYIKSLSRNRYLRLSETEPSPMKTVSSHHVKKPYQLLSL